MAQTTFTRGLCAEFVEQLNALYDQPNSWWRTMVDAEDLFLAVRENYVNIYYRGCSLLELPKWQTAAKPVGKKFISNTCCDRSTLIESVT